MTREQFESFLKSIFYPQVFSNFESFEAVYTNDQSKVYGVLTKYLRALGRIAFYLGEWDAAPDQPSKDVVAGSVTGDLGNASVDPAAALMWPDSGGLFGNVKGPSSSVDGSSAGFSGTSGQLLEEQSSSNGLIVFSADVDGKTVGNTSLFTVPAGKTFIPLKASYVLSTVSGLSLVSTVSIGANSPNYNNISGATLLTGLSTQGEALNVDLAATNSIAASSDVFVRVSIGSTATTYNLKASVIGYFI